MTSTTATTAARPIKRIIKFGLVSIAVELVTACPEPDPEFVTVHATDMGRMERHTVCKACTKPVAASETARAIDLGDGEYARLTDAEIAALATETRRIVTLDQFPPSSEIQPVMVEKIYYVLPVEGSREEYNMLRRVLEVKFAAGVGKIAFTGRERLAAIAPDRDHLMLYVLRFPDEIRAVVETPRLAIDETRLSNAEKLIDDTNRRAGIFSSQKPDWARYRDEYTERLRGLVNSKRKRPGVVGHLDLDQTLAKSVARARRSAKTDRKAA